MTEQIFIGVAWPYANGPLHLGHIAGAYLPADIFARYHRLNGNRVLMVSGSDQHGTPITIAAAQEGKKPQEIASAYHRLFLECWQKLGISFDIFTTTGTDNHARLTHDVFLTLLDKEYIYKATVPQAYCLHCERFLPDRYVVGTCPFCDSSRARGDQCDECGKPLNSADLIDFRCGICGDNAPEFRDSEHFFLRLSAFADQLLPWVSGQSHWRQNVKNSTISFIEGGLKDRAITRDLDWGVSVPQPGFENKRIYVWFEAVIGYLSASIEWATLQGNDSAWRPFWTGNAKTYYFIGKDNIPFHATIWPAILLGYGGLNLPYDIPANEFLTIEGKRLSTSRNWAVWLPDYLERYDPDALRYFLSANMPEGADSDFSWLGFVRRNNGELVGTYGNLAHRVLTFIHRNFDGLVPRPQNRCRTREDKTVSRRSSNLLGQAEDSLITVNNLLAHCHFREALRAAMSLAQEANRYLDEISPWNKLKEDPEGVEHCLHTAVVVLSFLKTMLYPFLPFSSHKLHFLLGLPGNLDEAGWTPQVPQPGQKLPFPTPLFAKLDDHLVEEEVGRLGQASDVPSILSE